MNLNQSVISNLKSGIFCISIDLELLWGRCDMPNLSFFERRISKERKVIKKLLALFDKYDVPATWATVGKMLEEGNSNYSGSDIVKQIKAIKNQEIASHSYTHPVFTEISKSKAISEFTKFKKKSFVFPRNKIKYLNELKKAGFKSYRGADSNPRELLLPRIPPVYDPQLEKGLLNIRGSMYFVSGRGFKRFIPPNLRYLKCKLGIDNAIKQKKVFHLWFHPMDFVDDSQKLFTDFEKILKYATSKRELEQLRILNLEKIVQIVK